VRVYRLEHHDSRKGPYNYGSYSPQGPGRMPCLEDDGVRGGHPAYGSKHYFGFASREQLLSWMGGDGHDAAACGFVVGVYEIIETERHAIVRGKHQCAFRREYAEHIEDLDPFLVLGAAHGPLNSDGEQTLSWDYGYKRPGWIDISLADLCIDARDRENCDYASSRLVGPPPARNAEPRRSFWN